MTVQVYAVYTGEFLGLEEMNNTCKKNMHTRIEENRIELGFEPFWA